MLQHSEFARIVTIQRKSTTTFVLQTAIVIILVSAREDDWSEHSAELR